MFELIFGAVWTAFSLFVFFMLSGSWFENGSLILDGDMLLSTVFIGIFVVIGLVIMIKGLKKVIANAKTSKHGEDGYAILRDILPTGSYVNGVPELKGVFFIYVLSNNHTEMIEEIIGFNPLKYQVNNYVKVKYYNGDINIIEKVSDELVPEHIKKYLGPIETNFNSNASDIIQIDGHTYKRID